MTAKQSTWELHPWDSWADGAWHTLTQGQDFNSSVRAMRSGASSHAVKRGLRAEVRTDRTGGDSVRIRIRFERLELVSPQRRQRARQLALSPLALVRVPKQRTESA